MTGDNLPWGGHFLWGSVNIFAYHWGIRQPGSGHTGIYSNMGELFKVTNYVFPTLNQEFQPYAASHKYDLPELLARKARNGRPIDRGGKNALITRFEEREIWRKTSGFLRKVCDNPRPLDIEEILAIQDRAQRVLYDKKAGVYITIHGFHHNDVRIGKAKNIATRTPAHKGYGYYLVRGYATATVAMAKALEDTIFEYLRNECPDLIAWEPKDGEGCFTFKPDVDAVQHLDLMIRTRYRHFFHQTAEFDRIQLWVP